MRRDEDTRLAAPPGTCTRPRSSRRDVLPFVRRALRGRLHDPALRHPVRARARDATVVRSSCAGAAATRSRSRGPVRSRASSSTCRLADGVVRALAPQGRNRILQPRGRSACRCSRSRRPSRKWWRHGDCPHRGARRRLRGPPRLQRARVGSSAGRTHTFEEGVRGYLAGGRARRCADPTRGAGGEPAAAPAARRVLDRLRVPLPRLRPALTTAVVSVGVLVGLRHRRLRSRSIPPKGSGPPSRAEGRSAA